MPTDLTIVIVSYNSLTDLQRCLPSIIRQSVSFTYQLIVVDNHGRDGVAPFIEQHVPAITFIANPANSGYAGGNNLGLQHSTGKWVLFLNPDTELHTGALQQLMQTAQAHPQAFINPKLINPDLTTINACGNQMQYTGITTCRGINELSSAYTGLTTVALLSGAALLAPTGLMRDLGGFDESYFMYFEDADLSLRARLRGYTLLCNQDAVITHYYRLGMNPVKFYYLERNRLLTLRKVLNQRTWRQLLPALILTELLTWGFSLRGITYLKSRFQTYAWLWQHRRAIRLQNEVIQQTRQLTDTQLMMGSTVAIPFEQLVPNPVGGLIKAILSPLYRALKPRQIITN
ncbi:glycosyltransferase family 2 protein [uncultured Fibrella sp.]|uniref:glycosyltransferase family 2 protein n=1 Tax=uncultured Fibrella sp. TaxID=1284596 RepID=UPI0035CBCB11